MDGGRDVPHRPHHGQASALDAPVVEGRSLVAPWPPRRTAPKRDRRADAPAPGSNHRGSRTCEPLSTRTPPPSQAEPSSRPSSVERALRDHAQPHRAMPALPRTGADVRSLRAENRHPAVALPSDKPRDARSRRTGSPVPRPADRPCCRATARHRRHGSSNDLHVRPMLPRNQPARDAPTTAPHRHVPLLHDARRRPPRPAARTVRSTCTLS